VLEQYHLLTSSYNLNTINVVNNPSGSNARPLYMYNRDMSILYYASAQQKDFIQDLNVHHSTFTKHLEKGTYYLGKYVFSREVVLTASVMNVSKVDLSTMLEADRIKFNINKLVLSNNCPIILLGEDKTKLLFRSKGECIRFLKSKGHKADQRTLTKLLDSDIKYYNYRCCTSTDS